MKRIRWAIEWRQIEHGRLVRFIMWNAGMPLLFATRQEARAHIEEHYGYIRYRGDLRAEPYNWRLPKAVKVNVRMEKI